MSDCGKGPDGSHSVHFKRGAIVMHSRGAKEVSVSMLLAEVGHALGEEQSVVALAQSAALGSTSTSRDDDEVCDVWLFVVPKGKDGLDWVLHALGKGGAVRGDAHGHLDIPKKPFSSGTGSRIYKVELKDKPREDEEDAVGSEGLAAKVVPAGSRSQVAQADLEVDLLLRAQGHPNIVRFRGVFFSDDWPRDEDEEAAGPKEERKPQEGRKPKESRRPRARQLLLIDYYARGTLHSCVKRNGPFPQAGALDLISELLSALIHIHSRGIVHRDVKADNILCGPGGEPILTDFGIAALLSDARAMKQRAGTPGYAAPELLSSTAPYGEKVDVFSTGVVLYFCVVTSHPFSPKSMDPDESILRTLECEVVFPDRPPAGGQMKRLIRILLAKEQLDRPNASGALSIVRLLAVGNSEDDVAATSPAEQKAYATAPQLLPNVASSTRDLPRLPWLGDRRKDKSEGSKYRSTTPSEHSVDGAPPHGGDKSSRGSSRLMPPWFGRSHKASSSGGQQAEGEERQSSKWSRSSSATRSPSKIETGDRQGRSPSGTSGRSKSVGWFGRRGKDAEADQSTDAGSAAASSRSPSPSPGWLNRFRRPAPPTIQVLPEATFDNPAARRTSDDSRVTGSVTGSVTNSLALGWTPRRGKAAPSSAVRTGSDGHEPIVEPMPSADASVVPPSAVGDSISTTSNSAGGNGFSWGWLHGRGKSSSVSRTNSDGHESSVAKTLSVGEASDAAGPSTPGLSPGWFSKRGGRKVSRTNSDGQENMSNTPSNGSASEVPPTASRGFGGSLTPGWLHRRQKTSPGAAPQGDGSEGAEGGLTAGE